MRPFIVIMVFTAASLAACAHHEIAGGKDRAILILKAPGAREVMFASSRDGFVPHPAHSTGDSTWEVTVQGCESFSYFYIVDGKVFTPPCKASEADGFGSRTCIYMPDMCNPVLD